MSTDFQDKYGNSATTVDFEPGRVIHIGKKDGEGRLLQAQIADEVWEYSDITKYSVDTERGIFKIADSKYSYDADLFVESNGEKIRLSDLNEKDKIRVVGIGTKILSVSVTTGQGILELRNTSVFEGSFIQVGSKIFAQITHNMKLEIPEGTYTVTVANEGYGGSKEVEIARGEICTLDLDELKGEGPKTGSITFYIDVEGATLSIDGDTVDYSAPVVLTYGVHELHAEADGYDDFDKKLFVVPEQELPDGDFPTVSYPNPEAAEAFELGLALGKKVDADLILATDPDADRLGVYVKDSKTGEYHSLTGNMSGCLIGDYVIGQRKALYGLPEDGAFIRSIVSTNMADAIAKYYGIQLVEVLTGFKFIGQKILEFENTGKGTYLFGMEESYGCLTGTYARDKDAVDASMTLCEAAAYYKTKNMTLWDAMLAMYERYGYYKDDVTAITLKGIEGLAKIQEIMNTLRENAPAEIGGYKVTAVRDYKKDTITDTATGAVKPTGLPASNVLYYELEDDAWVCVRPSGTEPKVKFYLGVKGTSLEDADAKSKALSESVHAMINKML